MREFEIYLIYGKELENIGDGWKGIIEDRKVENILTVEFGFAEEVICLIEFTDGTFEVGVGESMRPYSQRYIGDSRGVASVTFYNELAKHL